MPWRRQIGLQLAENLYKPRSLDVPNATGVYLLFQKTKVLGFCVVDQNKSEVHIQLLFIKEECRRRGLGSFLIQSVMRMQAQASFEVIHFRLQIKDEVWLKQFFSKFGFQEDAEDFHVMHKFYSLSYVKAGGP